MRRFLRQVKNLLPEMWLNKESFSIQLGNWFFSIFFSPSVWAFDYHKESPCCKFWLLLGPFEINRTWAEDDDYPFDSHHPFLDDDEAA